MVGRARSAARFATRGRHRRDIGGTRHLRNLARPRPRIAVKNAAALLAGFVARDVPIEITYRSKRRRFGRKHRIPPARAALPTSGRMNDVSVFAGAW